MTITNRLELSTSHGGVLLLEFIADDARPLFDLIRKNRDHLSRWDDVTSSRYPNFKSVLKSITHPVNPTKIRFGIWSEGVLTGTISITPKNRYTKEVGYWVGSEFCGKGLATLAAKRIILFGRQDADTNRMIASVYFENLASQSVLLKAGMSRTRRCDTLVWFAVDTTL